MLKSNSNYICGEIYKLSKQKSNPRWQVLKLSLTVHRKNSFKTTLKAKILQYKILPSIQYTFMYIQNINTVE